MRIGLILTCLLMSHAAFAQPTSPFLCTLAPAFPGCLPSGMPTRSSVAPIAIGDGLRGIQVQQLLQLVVPSDIPAAFASGDLRLFGWTDTTADQTTVFQRALDAMPPTGGVIVIPPGMNGTTLGSVTINKPVTIRGLGGPLGQAIVRPLTTTTTIFTVISEFVTFDDLAFGPLNPVTTKQTGGSYIYVARVSETISGSRFRATRLTMVEFNEGITVDNVGTVEISQFRGLLYSDGLGTSAACIHFKGGLDIRVDNVLCNGRPAMTATPNANAGIWIEALGDGTFSNMDIITMGTDLLVAPGTGQSVTSLWVVNSFLDSATRGIDFAPTSTGTIARARLSNVWASSHSQQGIRIGAGTNGVDITAPHVFFNAVNGIALMGGSNVAINGGQIGGNNNNGIYVAPGLKDWSVIGSTIGKTGGSLSGNTSYGIYVAADAPGATPPVVTDRYRMVDNLIQDNTTGGILDAGSGTHKSVWNNIGPADGYRAYRDGATGLLVIVGQQAAFSGFVFQTDDGTERFRITPSGISIGGRAVTFGAADSGGTGFRTMLVPN